MDLGGFDGQRLLVAAVVVILLFAVIAAGFFSLSTPPVTDSNAGSVPIVETNGNEGTPTQPVVQEKRSELRADNVVYRVSNSSFTPTFSPMEHLDYTADGVFAIVDVNLKNESSEEKLILLSTKVVLEDSEGNVFRVDTDVSEADTMNVQVNAGASLSRQLIFDVPTNIGKFKLKATGVVSGPEAEGFIEVAK